MAEMNDKKKKFKLIFSGNRAVRWAASWRSFYRKKIRNTTVRRNSTCWLLASANVGCDSSSARYINRHVQLTYCVSWKGMRAIGILKCRILGSAACSIPTKCPETLSTYTNFLTRVLCNFWMPRWFASSFAEKQKKIRLFPGWFYCEHRTVALRKYRGGS